MQRRFVIAAGMAVGELQRLDRNLAGPHDEWPANTHPALVDRAADACRRLSRRAFMEARIEDADDVTLDTNAVGDPQITFERLMNEVAERRFAVAWWAVDEQAAPRGGSQPGDLSGMF